MEGIQTQLNLYCRPDIRVSFLLTGSCSSWQTRNASHQRPLRKPHWTKCSSSPESQLAVWLMGTANRGSACSTIAPLGSRRRTEYTERHKQTHTNMLKVLMYQCVHGWTYTHLLQLFNHWFKKKKKCSGQLWNVSKLLCQIIYSYLTFRHWTWWWLHHITHRNWCTLFTVVLCCDQGWLCTHAHIQTHTEDYKCIYNLSVFGSRVSRAVNGNDPVGHHGIMVHTRQQMLLG